MNSINTNSTIATAAGRTLVTTLAAARLTRFITKDTLGGWLIREPIARAMQNYARAAADKHTREGRPGHPTPPWWWKYETGLHCKWCVGFWLAAGTLITEKATRGTCARPIIRTIGGALALNYVTAHLETLSEKIEDTNNDEN
jgi:hypothetical protein|nr:MAG TPA: Protein of unknown function (DUF1360) [Caudoviricetes sp.]